MPSLCLRPWAKGDGVYVAWHKNLCNAGPSVFRSRGPMLQNGALLGSVNFNNNTADTFLRTYIYACRFSVLVQSPKLSNTGRGQYLEEWPLGNVFFLYLCYTQTNKQNAMSNTDVGWGALCLLDTEFYIWVTYLNSAAQIWDFVSLGRKSYKANSKEHSLSPDANSRSASQEIPQLLRTQRFITVFI